MDNDVLIAAIGVGGTLLGTLLGWFLNNLSQMGKLHIFVDRWAEKFEKNQDGRNMPCASLEETEYYGFVLSLDLYNSSGETKIMRDIQIVHANGKILYRNQTPNDHTTRRFSCGTTRYDKVTPINIAPKSVLKLILSDGEWNENGSLDFLAQTSRVYLQYTDERNKRRKKLIAKVSYTADLTSASDTDF